MSVELSSAMSAERAAPSTVDLNQVRHQLGLQGPHAGAAETPLRAAKGPPGKKDRPGGPGDDDGKTGLITKTRPVTKKPHLYKVLLLNDDYTPMEFVTLILERFFNKSREDATRIMYHVHQKGVGVCGVYTFEVAETKIAQVMDFARQHQHPLQCRMEKE